MYSCTGNQAFTLIGFPHSDTHGFADICSYPWLFAACRVLHRLSVPRHSPCALSNLTCYGSLSFRRYPNTMSEAFSPRLAHPLLIDLQVLFSLLLFVFNIFSLSSLCSCQGTYRLRASLSAGARNSRFLQVCAVGFASIVCKLAFANLWL